MCSSDLDHQVGIGVRSHHTRHQLGGCGVTPVLTRIRNDSVGQAMLVVDGDDGQPLLVSHMAGQGLKVSDDEVDLPLVDEAFETREAASRLGHGDEILRDRSLVANAIVHVSESEAVDFGNVEVLAQVLKAAVEGGPVHCVTLRNEMREHLFGAGRVPRTLAVHSIKNVGHRRREYTLSIDVPCFGGARDLIRPTHFKSS